MPEINHLSRDIDLGDRQPDIDYTSFSSASPHKESISIEDIHKSKEDFNQMIETMEKFKTFPRKQRRKIIKPSFSSTVKKSFKKGF